MRIRIFPSYVFGSSSTVMFQVSISSSLYFFLPEVHSFCTSGGRIHNSTGRNIQISTFCLILCHQSSQRTEWQVDCCIYNSYCQVISKERIYDLSCSAEIRSCKHQHQRYRKRNTPPEKPWTCFSVFTVNLLHKRSDDQVTDTVQQTGDQQDCSNYTGPRPAMFVRK